MNTQLNRVLCTHAVEMTSPRRIEACSAVPSDTLVLSDGTQLRIRPLGVRDRDGMAQLFARLSPESRYRRFLAPKPDRKSVVEGKGVDDGGRERVRREEG